MDCSDVDRSVEPPDKSMFASLVMAARGRPLQVWLGAALAFPRGIAVTVGVALDAREPFIPSSWCASRARDIHEAECNMSSMTERTIVPESAESRPMVRWSRNCAVQRTREARCLTATK